ncbi:hypothetical protein HU200_052362 [Digitaria exilis]|uniref:RING-type E3 ubiquitin transferase n=1 Tax=Digitaria exilis TaxID=1010633 RepID=A0A835ARM1_9POAL|nr:hypothetical protein HU200_052362 [Digitaria exilis]
MDWSEEWYDEEEEPSLRRRPRSLPGSRRSSPPRARDSGGSRSPAAPRRGGLAQASAGSRSPSPRRASLMATRLGSSVRTTPRSPPPRTPSADSPSRGDVAGGADDTGVAEIIAKTKKELPAPAAARDDAETSAAGASASRGGGADEEESRAAEGFIGFSLQELEASPGVDGAEVLDAFAGSDDAARKGKAAEEFLEATMGANTGARTEAIKAELVVNGRVLDLEGLERWMRRTEAVSELEWFVGLCCDEEKPAPHVELFECAFRALENASARELHRGAEARRGWIGSVGVPRFFVCPISNKVMENPVVIASGKVPWISLVCSVLFHYINIFLDPAIAVWIHCNPKILAISEQTVDRSALEEWRKDHGRICPVTGEVLSHTMFIPNILIKLCIARWQAANKIADVTAAAEPQPPAIPPDVEALFKQVTLMPHSPRSSKEVRDALFILKDLLTTNETSIVHLIGTHLGIIAKLISVLPETCLDPDPELDDIIIGVLEKAASYGPNKKLFGDDRYAIPVLISRAFLGPVQTRARCAHILGLLADDEHYNKIKIGELGGFAPMVELLYVGDKGVKKMVARAIASLCEARENQSRFHREGVVDATISMLRSDGLVLEAQGILLQAAGSDHAMREVISKLQEVQGDEMCRKMASRLWNTFVLTNPDAKLDVVPSMPASKKTWEQASTSTSTSDAEISSTSSGGSSDVKVLSKQINEDVKIIVSWLQKRCYYPRTYRYRE